MNQQHIVILGAGYAGIRAAKNLLRRSDGIQVTLIDQGSAHHLLTSLHEAASGRVEAQSLVIPLEEIFMNKPIRLVHDRILAMDLKGKKLSGEKDSYAFDHLIMASGARAFYNDVPGAKESSYPLDTLEAALAIRRRLDEPATREVLISGGGLTGVELAADLKAMRPRLTVTLVESKAEILADLDASIRRYAAKRLQRLGVTVLAGHRVTAVEPGGAEVADRQGDSFHQPGLVIWTTGTRPDWTERVDEAQAPDLDEALRLRGYANVWVTGDAGDPGWATVENGLQSADRVTANLLRELDGEAALAYAPKPRGQMIALGPGDGITTTKIPLKGWPAAALKFLVDLVYLFRIGGIGPPVNYFNGRLVRPAHQQTLTGSLLSSRGQRLWLFPLRLYLGSLWLLEGFKKIIGPQQFAGAAKLSDYLTIGSDSWLRQGNLNVPFAWLTSADAVSGATMAGTNGP
ncbi:MAG TPA: FAD-dependent oxidoreductase, partial [Thioalkalivibrio sp.]|nr:FAD-dependent oxidoreductase [Thioalkalivibrio sp.]